MPFRLLLTFQFVITRQWLQRNTKPHKRRRLQSTWISTLRFRQRCQRFSSVITVFGKAHWKNFMKSQLINLLLRFSSYLWENVKRSVLCANNSSLKHNWHNIRFYNCESQSRMYENFNSRLLSLLCAFLLQHRLRFITKTSHWSFTKKLHISSSPAVQSREKLTPAQRKLVKTLMKKAKDFFNNL